MKLFILFISSLLCYTNSAPAEDECVRLRMADNSANNITDGQLSDLIQTSVLEVASLGKVADLGDVYDARTDQFIGISLYKKNIPGDIVEKLDTPHSNIKYVLTETFKEKIRNLEISPKLAVSFLCGLIKVEGSARYLKESKKSSDSIKTSLVYSIKTVQEHLRIFSHVSKCLISTNILKMVDATHVVVGIEWGANVVLSLEQIDSYSSNKIEKLGSLKGALSSVGLQISGAIEPSVSDTEKYNNINIRINGDIIPDTIPQTVDQAVQFIKQIPNLIERSNGGKGRITKYILMPLQTVRKIMIKDIQIRDLVQEISKGLTDQFLGIFQEIKDTQLLLNDIYNDLKKWNLMLPEDHFKNVSTLKSNFENCTNDLKVKFAALAIEFRSGRAKGSILRNLIDNYFIGNCTSHKTDELLKPYNGTFRKIRLLNLFEGYNALFIDRRTDKNQILTINYQKEVGIISVDLNLDVSSQYVRGIVKLLQVEGAKNPSKAITYYIEDNPEFKIPKADIFLEGDLKNSYPIGKREYVILISRYGDTIITDIESYNPVKTFQSKILAGSSFAIVGDSFYKINTKAGHIEAIKTEDFMKKDLSSLGIKWNRVGWFPKESYEMYGVAAVNNSHFYFLSANGVLYKYDTMLKTVTNCAQVLSSSSPVGFFSAVMVNGILYFSMSDRLLSFNGTKLEDLDPLETRYEPGMFEYQGLVCRVGGQLDCSKACSPGCMDPKVKNHTIIYMQGENIIIKRFPAIIKTKLGVISFGGMSLGMHGLKEVNSAEIYSYRDKVWSYIPTSSAMKEGIYFALSFFF